MIAFFLLHTLNVFMTGFLVGLLNSRGHHKQTDCPEVIEHVRKH